MQTDIRKFPSFPFSDFENSFETVKSFINLIIDHPQSIMHTYKELCALYELACGYHDTSNGFIVQFGLYRGGSASAMGFALKSIETHHAKPVIAIDPYLDMNPPYGDSYRVVKENIQKLNLEDYVCPIIFKDVEFIRKFWEKPVRLVMIDTIHSYQQTKDEIACILPYVVKGGWMVFHDYRLEFAGCALAINELIEAENISEVYRIYHDDPAADSLILMKIQ